MNGVEESDEERFFECQVNVTLPSRTPVVGIEFTPNVFVSRNQGSSNVLQQNLLRFTWNFMDDFLLVVHCLWKI
ncbi:hypothetical protein TIFTF001_014514, partial [Ficus carica]